MSGRYPCGGLRRRDFLGAFATPVLASAVVSAQETVKKNPFACAGRGARGSRPLPWSGRRDPQ